MLDNFQMGPNLVRGFAPAGIGPTRFTQLPFTGIFGDALRRHLLLGCELQVQTPLYFLPKMQASKSPLSLMPVRSGILPGRRRSRHGRGHFG